MGDWQKYKNTLENEPKENTENKVHGQTTEDYQTNYYAFIQWIFRSLLYRTEKYPQRGKIQNDNTKWKETFYSGWSPFWGKSVHTNIGRTHTNLLTEVTSVSGKLISPWIFFCKWRG